MHESKPAEALTHAQRAVDIAGPHPELLDTRALVLLKAGKALLAVDDLNQAIAQAPTPAMYLHLAQAQHLAKNAQAAATAYRRATNAGLAPDSLHPLERTTLQQLAAALKEN